MGIDDHLPKSNPRKVRWKEIAEESRKKHWT